jgi:hypothetical protein
MLTVVKPSPLRLWGFVLTVLGGALLAFGSISDWAAVALGGSAEAAVPTKGIDVWQGKVTLALGGLIVVGILALRFVRPERRTPVAIALIVLGLVALGLSLWCVASLDTVVTDQGVDALVRTVVGRFGIPAEQARQLIAEAMAGAGVEVQAQTGLWITLVGAIVATLGGGVDLAWVRRKRALGDAIDPDTTAAGPSEPGAPGQADQP